MDPEHGKRFPCRILIIEDMEATAALAKAVLRRMGHTAHIARSGAEALAGESPFDLALVDLHLPGEDGMEIAREIIARGVTVPWTLGLSAAIGVMLMLSREIFRQRDAACGK